MKKMLLTWATATLLLGVAQAQIVHQTETLAPPASAAKTTVPAPSAPTPSDPSAAGFLMGLLVFGAGGYLLTTDKTPAPPTLTG